MGTGRNLLRSEFSCSCSCAVNTRMIITYFKQTARVIILKSTQKKTNHFEMIMKSLCGLCISKFQKIYAFFYHDFLGHPLLVNYSNAYRPREEHKSSELSIM